jgi:heptaprenyl diphosphate synthase
MGRFGEYIGTSFQINDDLIDVDISGTATLVGKPVGNDLRQGDITLPFIYGFEDAKFKKEIMPILKKGILSDSDLNKILARLTETDAIKKTRDKCYKYINMAASIVKNIDGEQRKAGLLKVCEMIINSSRLAK